MSIHNEGNQFMDDQERIRLEKNLTDAALELFGYTNAHAILYRS